MALKRVLLVACLLAAFGATAQAASAPASLRGYVCSPNLQPPLRGLSVTAVMRPVSGTEKLRMRFALLRAAHRAGPYRVVHGANLGRWIGPPDPTLGRQPGDVWQVSHPVVNVTTPGYYRLQVAFAWLGLNGRRLASTTRTAPACALLELRPDLLVSSIPAPTPIAARPGKDVYLASIRNRGATAAGPFEVALSVAGGTSVTHTVTGLGAHSGRQLRFVAPACAAGDAITVTVDPGHQVLDYDLANNSLTVVCPGAG